LEIPWEVEFPPKGGLGFGAWDLEFPEEERSPPQIFAEGCGDTSLR
jgi:hypothetical protein